LCIIFRRDSQTLIRQVKPQKQNKDEINNRAPWIAGTSRAAAAAPLCKVASSR
jgi:hypothetical protein